MGNPPITFLRQVLALGKNKSSPKNIVLVHKYAKRSQGLINML